MCEVSPYATDAAEGSRPSGDGFEGDGRSTGCRWCTPLLWRLRSRESSSTAT